jgi:hypothetical protein
VGESELPGDRQSTDESAQWPPPEWGKERSPIVGTIVTVAVIALCAVVVAGIAVWGFDVLGSGDDTTGAEQPNVVSDAGVPASTTATRRGANEANVGDCVNIVKGGVDAELEVVECGAVDARYTVALELEMPEKCPADSYLEYAAMGLGGWSLCLALNAAVGQCFKTSVTDGFTLTDCATADFAVAAVLANTADENACPPPPPNVLFQPKPLVYPTPPLTICLASITR